MQFAVPFIFKHVLKGYQADRIFSMVGKSNPYADEKTVQLNRWMKSEKRKSAGLQRKTIQDRHRARAALPERLSERNTDPREILYPNSIPTSSLHPSGELQILGHPSSCCSIFPVAPDRAYCRAAAKHLQPGLRLFGGRHHLLPRVGEYLRNHRPGAGDRYHPAPDELRRIFLLTFTILLFILIKLDADRQMVLR